MALCMPDSRHATRECYRGLAYDSDFRPPPVCAIVPVAPSCLGSREHSTNNAAASLVHEQGKADGACCFAVYLISPDRGKDEFGRS